MECTISEWNCDFDFELTNLLFHHSSHSIWFLPPLFTRHGPVSSGCRMGICCAPSGGSITCMNSRWLEKTDLKSHKHDLSISGSEVCRWATGWATNEFISRMRVCELTCLQQKRMLIEYEIQPHISLLDVEFAHD